MDIAARRPVVRLQLEHVGEEVLEGTIKMEAGQNRAVALSARAVAALRTWQFQQGQEREAWGDAYRDSGRVATYGDGRQLRLDYPS